MLQETESQVQSPYLSGVRDVSFLKEEKRRHEGNEISFTNME